MLEGGASSLLQQTLPISNFKITIFYEYNKKVSFKMNKIFYENVRFQFPPLQYDGSLSMRNQF